MCLSNGLSSCSANCVNRIPTSAALFTTAASRVSAAAGTVARAFSSLWRIYRRVQAWALFTHPECLRSGHRLREIRSGNLYFQKERQPRRDWYDGVYVTCGRPGCEYSRFDGVRTPWRSDRDGDQFPKEN